MYQGQEAQADCIHDTDRDGKTRLKVNWINGIGVQMKNKMEGAQLATLAKRIRGVAARIGGAAAQQGGGGGLPPVRNQGTQRDVPPPDDRDAPPWNGRGGQQGSGYRR
jgi:hypothetical protein